MGRQIKSEMAGTIIELKVKAGDTIAAGDQVAVVESMKMEVPVLASSAGRITRVTKAVGDFLNEGETLLELE